MSFNLSVVIREPARSNPDKVAIIADDRRLSYAQLDHASNILAGNLASNGIEPGDAVGLQLPNIPEFVVAFYGILKAGAVAIPMNILNKAPEVAYFLKDAGAKALITSADFAEEGARGAELADVRKVYVQGDGAKVTTRLTLQRFAELLEPVEGLAPYVQRDPGDTAVLLYTSGTTGQPKGVELTHFQLFMNARAHVEGYEMSSDTVNIAVMPLFHTLGLSGILNATLSEGGTVVLIKRFDAVKMYEAIQNHKATLIHGVPTMYHELLHHPRAKEFDTSSLKVCGSAGSALASELLDRIQREFGVVVLEAYGLTESGPIATMNRRGRSKPYSIGTPVWGVEVQIWDEKLQRMPPGRENIGEFVIRGHNTMRGYLNKPQATEDAFLGGWLHTGDLGYQDEDGFFFIVDRKKEMIIRGGYNVYPREIEEVLYKHPAVAEAAVIGIPNEKLGEEVKAYVTMKSGASITPKELIEFVKSQVAAYKYPRFLEIIETLPKSATGKIMKKMLKAPAGE